MAVLPWWPKITRHLTKMAIVMCTLTLKATFLFNHCQQGNISKSHSFWANFIKQESRTWRTPPVPLLEFHCKRYSVSLIFIFLITLSSSQHQNWFAVPKHTAGQVGRGSVLGSVLPEGPNSSQDYTGLKITAMYPGQLSDWAWHVDRARGRLLGPGLDFSYLFPISQVIGISLWA